MIIMHVLQIRELSLKKLNNAQHRPHCVVKESNSVHPASEPICLVLLLLLFKTGGKFSVIISHLLAPFSLTFPMKGNKELSTYNFE